MEEECIAVHIVVHDELSYVCTEYSVDTYSYPAGSYVGLGMTTHSVLIGLRSEGPSSLVLRTPYSVLHPPISPMLASPVEGGIRRMAKCRCEASRLGQLALPNKKIKSSVSVLQCYS